MTLIHVVGKVAEPKVKSSSEFNNAKNVFPLWSLLPHTRFEYLSCNGISCFEVWQSVWLLVVISNSEKQRLTSGKLWVFLSQKKKIKPKSLLSWSVLGKASKCFQQQNWKSGFDNSYNYFKWKKKILRKSIRLFWNSYCMLCVLLPYGFFSFSRRGKKKIRLVPSTDHHRKD